MTPLPLAQIGLRWRDYRSALWWLGILYRRPQQLRKRLEALPKFQALRAGGALCLHALPYIVILSIIGRLVLFGVLGFKLQDSPSTGLTGVLFTHSVLLFKGIYFGVSLSFLIEVSFWSNKSIPSLKRIGTIGRIIFLISLGNLLIICVSNIVFDLNFGAMFLAIFLIIQEAIVIKIVNTNTTINISYITMFEIVSGLASVIFYAICLGVTFGLSTDLSSLPVSIVVFEIVFGIYFGSIRKADTGRSPDFADWVFYGAMFGFFGGVICTLIAYRTANETVASIFYGITAGIFYWIISGLTLLRAYYYPVHFLFIWPKLKGHLYSQHPVVWDDLCSLPFLGLDRLLAAYADHDSSAAQTEIERLIDHYPSQRMAALRAKTRLIARASAQETNLSRLDARLAQLSEGDKGFLAWTQKVRVIVGDISQLQIHLDTLDRPFLREPTAALLVEKIKNFQSQVAGFPEPLASEFRQAASEWLTIAERQYQKIRGVLKKEPTPQVFQAGKPVDRNQEAFIPRESVLGDLNRQLTLSTDCPGLILYGRRRMGKTTLLRNLEDFLPTSVRIAVVSMQNPDAFSSQTDLLNTITRQTLKAIQSEQKPPAPTIATLKDFFQWLSDCNAHLAETDRHLLLTIDEYENLDRKLGEGVFSEDLLATVRESIQTHRQMAWVFAGSHAITELTHAPWPSYLVSARTLEVPPFTEAETRRLLTEPLRYSSLWRDDDLKRPRFSPDFWGDNGIERIHVEAGGWPHLVQLLAETVVDLCNDQGLSHADQALLEQAIAKAVGVGDTVLRQLMQPEDAVPHEWGYLRGFRTRDTQPPPEDDAVYQALRRRLLVAEEGGQWRLRVPLMQRWLRERG